ncbi:hypothetical protein LB507_008981 [Fusarium sp. FIESC RH6]|nr:hypothetical protein LB507_008981 [Fusarium sp. FIESC RH6]
MAQSPSSGCSLLLAIPPEIRQKIYELCIPPDVRLNVGRGLCYMIRGEGDGFQYEQKTHGSEDIAVLEDAGEDIIESDPVEADDGGLSDPPTVQDIGVSPTHRDPFPGLLFVCRHITDEIKPMIYRSVTLTVDICDGGEAYMASVFSLETREHFRKMILVVTSDTLCDGADFEMNPKVWDQVLKNLSILGIVIEPPESWISYYEEKNWTAWLTTTLEYINRATSTEMKIVADTNKMAEATQIVEKAMPGRCNFQNLRDGDKIFERAEYSYASGYWDDDGPTSCRDIIDDCDFDYYYSD